MRTPPREPISSVMQRLLDEPQSFEFTQAVHLLVLYLRDCGVSYEEAFTHVLRFQNSLRLGFPPSEIEAVRAGGAVGAGSGATPNLALAQDAGTQIHVTPAFMGFLGVCGALPYHYTEQIAGVLHEEKDAGPRAFVDMFSNRFVGMFYRAWGKYRLEQILETQEEDAMLDIFNALGGVNKELFATLAGKRELGGVNKHVAAYYAAMFRTKPASAHTIATVFTDYFGVPIRVEQFVGSWETMPENERTKLGGKYPKMGQGAALGSRVWRRDRRARLHIGPLDEEQFERFLPRSEGAAALERMLEMAGTERIVFEVRLIMKQSCVKPLILTSSHSPAPRRLGWTAFVRSGTAPIPNPEVRYLLHPK